MIYEKRLPTKNYKYKSITITDFSQGVDSELNGELTKYKKPIMLYNFLTENGKLESGYGLERLTIPKSEDDAEATLDPSYESLGVEYVRAWVYRYYNLEKEKND